LTKVVFVRFRAPLQLMETLCEFVEV
jgi:hypothetical protein